MRPELDVMPSGYGEVVASPRRSSTEVLRVALCAVLILLGIAVISGWLLGIQPLKSALPGFPSMKFNTALGFLGTGTGMLLVGLQAKAARYAGVACGLFVAALGAATLLEYATNVDLGIDQAVVLDSGSLVGSGIAGRMSLLTAIAWLALGVAIVLLGIATRRSEVIIAHSLAMAAGAVSVIAAAGYAFGAEAFFALGRFTSIAVHTAAGLLVAASAALMTRAREGWLQPYVDSPAALTLLSRILPLSLGVPIALGLIIMLGAGLGAYNAPYGFALFIPLTGVAMVLTSLWVGRQQRVEEQTRLRYERHLQLVVAELNHRVKNTLAIVQSFAHQSLKNSANPQEAGAVFEGRLTALASVHRMLTRENWDNIDLTELVANSIEVHNDSGLRFAIQGPEIAVSPKSAITFAMTLHELATNSTKYGALSEPDGHVRISWSMDRERFQMEWQEAGGPPCAAPQRSGFGSRMLTRALASELGGKAALYFEPQGLRYEIAAPARAEL